MTKSRAGEKILLIIMLVCLAYYILAGQIFGFGISLLWLWLFLAAFFGIWLLYLIFVRKSKIKPLPEKLILVFKIIFIIGLLLFIFLLGCIFWGMAQQAPPGMDYIMVLGAAVHGETPSVALQLRMQKAYEYAVANPQTKIICTGGQGRGEDITEAEAMRRYFMQKGIDESRLIIEENSSSTAENFRFSLSLIPQENAKIGVVTSNFHVFRSLCLANKISELEFYGLATPYPNALFIHYILREAAVTVIDYLKGNI